MPEDDKLRRAWARATARSAEAHGILALKDTREAGLTEYQVRRFVHDGTLVQEFRGIYRWAGSPRTDLQRIKLAVAATGGVASHQSAARLWGFEEWDPHIAHVTVVRGIRSQGRPWLVSHTTSRPLVGLTVVRHGIEVTKPLRTLLDLAGVSPAAVADEQLDDLLTHVVSRRLVSVAQVTRYLDKTGTRVAGVRRLRALIGDLDGGLTESVAERELLRVLAGAGIEKPLTQFAIYRDGRFVARTDAAWPRQRVALEVDGYRYHSDPRTFVADRVRGNEIVAAGYRLMRTTPATIRQHPNRLCAEVLDALNQAPGCSVADASARLRAIFRVDSVDAGAPTEDRETFPERTQRHALVVDQT